MPLSNKWGILLAADPVSDYLLLATVVVAFLLIYRVAVRDDEEEMFRSILDDDVGMGGGDLERDRPRDPT